MSGHDGSEGRGAVAERRRERGKAPGQGEGTPGERGRALLGGSPGDIGDPGIFPSEEEFLDLAERYGLVPVARRMPLEAQTPLSLFRRFRSGERSAWAVLLESGDRGTRGGRYSFLGFRPLRTYRVPARGEVALGDGIGEGAPIRGDLLRILEADMESLRPASLPGLPPFSGGVVGFFGYEMIEEWEDLFHDRPGALSRPDSPTAMLMIPGSVAAVDHVERSLTRVENVPVGGCAPEERRSRYRAARDRLLRSAGGLGAGTGASDGGAALELRPEIPRERFLEGVRRAKERIRDGEACQIVLSQRFVAEAPGLPTERLYGALKAENPSPYLFLLDFPGLALVGSSPEVLVRVEGRKVLSRPLAGTRRRGLTLAEDLSLEEELIADGKELAEHAMLVDLARNDLARVCLPESVRVTEYREVERYARVMHLSSQVEGLLAPGRTPLEALRAAFPAGTVSGAPKIRAMEILAELEGTPRGPYAGAVGYWDFGGTLDTCIAIRTFEVREGRVALRAGAGVVADSDPEREYEETLHKAQALFSALERATGRRDAGEAERGTRG